MMSRWRYRRLLNGLYFYPVGGTRPHKVVLVGVAADRGTDLLLHFARIGVHPSERRVSLWASMTSSGLVLHDPHRCCWAGGTHDPIGAAPTVQSAHQRLTIEMARPAFLRRVITGQEHLRADYCRSTPRRQRGDERYQAVMAAFDRADAVLRLGLEAGHVREIVLAAITPDAPLPDLVTAARAAVAA